MTSEYYSNLCSLGATCGPFSHVCNDNYRDYFPNESVGFSFEKYQKNASLLYTTKTNEFLEFANGNPSGLVCYRILVSVVKRDPDNFGLCNDTYLDDTVSIHENNFYEQFFAYNSCNVKPERHQRYPDFSKELWCEECCGECYHIQYLPKIMHDKMNVNDIPKESVGYIEKIVQPLTGVLVSQDAVAINQTDSDILERVKDILNRDLKVINGIKLNIDQSEDRITLVVENMKKERAVQQNKMDLILVERGGSLEKYQQMVNNFNTKVELVNLQKQMALEKEKLNAILHERQVSINTLIKSIQETELKIKLLEKSTQQIKN